ncbi:MAG: CHAT domain-containing protein [Chitinophagaceae bacterium]|nr:CHAT domain-containing protein [Chitinophagaceae bacterium]
MDEQSGSFITEKFIENLAAKMPAGEALQQAKLQYLQQAEGRMKSPAYWAGLVLMGDAGMVMLAPKQNYAMWLLLTGILACSGAVVFFVMNRKSKIKQNAV